VCAELAGAAQSISDKPTRQHCATEVEHPSFAEQGLKIRTATQCCELRITLYLFVVVLHAEVSGQVSAAQQLDSASRAAFGEPLSFRRRYPLVPCDRRGTRHGGWTSGPAENCPPGLSVQDVVLITSSIMSTA